MPMSMPPRHGIQFFRSLLFVTLMYLWMLILGVIGLPFAMLSRKLTFSFIKIYCRNILWLLRALCGVETQVRGTIPAGDVVVVSKHQSFLDVILHIVSLEQPQFVMKRELTWIPLFGFYALRIGCTPINREDRSRSVERVEEGARKSEGSGSQIVIYPQGTRVPPGDKVRYRGGAAILYHNHGSKCILAATNVGHFWPRRAIYRQPGMAVIEYLGSVPGGMTRAQFMNWIENEIEDASDRLSAEAGYTVDVKSS